MRIQTQVGLVAACGLGLAAGALGQVMAYDNFGPENAYNTANGYFVRGPFHASTSPDWTQGFRFTSMASGGISEIFLPLQHTGATNEFRYEVRADEAGVPGTLIGQFTGVIAGSAANRLITIPGDGTVMLEQGREYWLILYAINDGSGTWYQNNQSDSLMRCLSRNQGATWTYGIVNAAVFRITLQEGAGCYANCDGSTVEPILNIDDFTCFISEFASAQSLPPEQQVTSYANCDQSTIPPVLNIDDFTCFISEFAAGCP